jgi:uncharacterized protein
MKKIALTFAILLGVTSYVSAFVLPEKPTGYVNDYANVLQADTKSQLEEILRAYSASTTNEIAVVTVPDLGGDTVERYAVKLFELWKIGNAKNDNGVLLLVALQDRKVRIEVGYGLEGALPDITAKSIIDTQITPAFKQGDYALGILQGVRAITEATRGEYVATEKATKSFDLNTIEFILIAGFFVLEFLSAILARSKSWWAGGIMGGVIGAVVTFFGIFGVTMLIGGVITVVLILLGLLFDYIVSNAYTSSVSHGAGIPWWAGGGRGGSSGGSSFGGFGGGSTGGGGASGSW